MLRASYNVTPVCLLLCSLGACYGASDHAKVSYSPVSPGTGTPSDDTGTAAAADPNAVSGAGGVDPNGPRPSLSLRLGQDPNLCLAADANTVSAALCDGSAAQRFTLTHGQLRRGASCLDLRGDTVVSGVAAAWSACDPNAARAAQLWSDRGDTLSVQNTSFCLDTGAATVAVQGCTGAPSQSFVFVVHGKAAVGAALSPGLDPNRCLADPNGNVGNGAAPALVACDRDVTQLWSRAGDHLMVNGRCLDLPLGNTTNGTALQFWDCIGASDFQRWILEGGMLRPATAPLKCVELAGDATLGQTLRIGDCAGTPAQLWDLGGDLPSK
jgi:hypothetical protein